MDKQKQIKNYYKFHSNIYDITRWTFLFGRKRLINNLLPHLNEKSKVLEIGCGTGSILKELEQNSEAELYGLDFSEEMLKKAGNKLKRTKLINARFEEGIFDDLKFDVIIVSYFLTFFKNKEAILDLIKSNLNDGGLIANVDFSSANINLYDSFMQKNNILIDSNLIDQMNVRFDKVFEYSNKAYLGLWNFYLFIGKNKG